MPVFPGRVHGFSRKNKDKPTTLPGYTGHSSISGMIDKNCDACEGTQSLLKNCENNLKTRGLAARERKHYLH